MAKRCEYNEITNTWTLTGGTIDSPITPADLDMFAGSNIILNSDLCFGTNTNCKTTNCKTTNCKTKRPSHIRKEEWDLMSFLMREYVTRK